MGRLRFLLAHNVLFRPCEGWAGPRKLCSAFPVSKPNGDSLARRNETNFDPYMKLRNLLKKRIECIDR